MDKKISINQIILFQNENKDLVKEIYSMDHAMRLNGVVDIYKQGFCVYDRCKNIYHKFEKIADVLLMAKKVLSENPQRPRHDSKVNGKITLKTLKKIVASSDFRPENDHWKVHAEKISDDHLYFASDGLGRIKIGRSKNPKHRIKGINTGNASDVQLLMIIRNKGCLETIMHNCFSDVRIKGEWFSYSERFDDFMEHVRKNNQNCSISFFKESDRVI